LLTEQKAALNKQKFSQLVKDYNSISTDDRNKLHELVSNYPYSQVLHTLIAKANKDANTDIANQTLGYAAMYAADRSVLKEVIETRPASVKPIESVEKTQVKSSASTVQKDPKPELPPKQKGKKITVDVSLLNKQSLSDTIMADLSALKESKANYMEWLSMPDEKPLEAKQKTPPKKSVPKKKTKTPKPTTTSKSTASAKPKPKKETKSTAKKNTSATAAKKKTVAKKKETPKKEVEKKTKASTETKKAAPKKTKPSPKEKSAEDQSHIIDNFISKEPSITSRPSKKAPSNQEDLSQPSTTFNEDLISENLAKIFISQGKADKAIDIYKKLIWKFPQKKSYFATQIEKLKK